MLFKKFVLASPLALLGAANIALAADPIEHQVSVVASIPSEAFFIEPSVPGWIGADQRLEWLPASKALKPIVHLFDAKSTIGPIEAKLLSAAELSDGGSNKIDLDVSFNGTRLSTAAAEVLSQADANTGKRVEFKVAAIEPVGGYKPSNSYRGQVNMMFETQAP